MLQAVKETGHKFRETILALGGGKAPLAVSKNYIYCYNSFTCARPLSSQDVN
jgi:Zn-dependent oligopeptidase